MPPADTKTCLEHTRFALDYELLNNKLEAQRRAYQSAEPFPHIVIDSFLNNDAAKRVCDQFPTPKSGQWIHYLHVNENKHGKNKREELPKAILDVLDELNSQAFLDYLSELTGIPNLLADPNFEGGGLHASGRGGYLNIHADFTVHPHRRDWRRRVNVLIYLNPSWKEEWGGHIELWDKKMTTCVKRASPIFNRCLIFNTDKDSFHGHPEPMTCPEGVMRKSIALYYFTQGEKNEVRSTNYRPRPQDNPLKGALIHADRLAVKVYDFIKRKLGFDDTLVSKTLRKLSWHRKKD